MATEACTRRRRFVCVALVFSAASCVDQTAISPSAEAIVVHAVLDASARDQYVVVQTTNGAITSQRAVSGATVIIVTPDGRALAADEVHDSTRYDVRSGEPRVTSLYRVSLDRYGVALISGAAYRLHVTLPDQREVTGSTTIPGSGSGALLDLPQTIARATDTLTLAWPRVSGAAAYDVSISSSRSSYSVFADTSIVLPGRTDNTDGTPAFVGGLTHQIVVSAVDANYYDYYRRGSDLFTGAGPITRLTGAMGVFGSIVPLGRGTITVR